MHEHSLMADLLKKIETVARQKGGGRVVAVRVKLGALSNITREHFEEHFRMETRGTAAEGARLDLEQITDKADPNAQKLLLDSVEVEF